MRGAARSPGGKAIIAMPSTAQHYTISRIVPTLSAGGGVTTTRGDVQFVVTEFGVGDLRGKSIMERALALIGISHPRFRAELLMHAKSCITCTRTRWRPATWASIRSSTSPCAWSPTRRCTSGRRSHGRANAQGDVLLAVQGHRLQPLHGAQAQHAPPRADAHREHRLRHPHDPLRIRQRGGGVVHDLLRHVRSGQDVQTPPRYPSP